MNKKNCKNELEEEFQFYFKFLEMFMFKMNPIDRKTLELWINKIVSSNVNIDIKVGYLKILSFLLRKGVLVGFFTSPPRRGELEKLPLHYTLSNFNLYFERLQDDGLFESEKASNESSIESLPAWIRYDQKSNTNSCVLCDSCGKKFENRMKLSKMTSNHSLSSIEKEVVADVSKASSTYLTAYSGTSVLRRDENPTTAVTDYIKSDCSLNRNLKIGSDHDFLQTTSRNLSKTPNYQRSFEDSKVPYSFCSFCDFGYFEENLSRYRLNHNHFSDLNCVLCNYHRPYRYLCHERRTNNFRYLGFFSRSNVERSPKQYVLVTQGERGLAAGNSGLMKRNPAIHATYLRTKPKIISTFGSKNCK